MNSEGLHQVVTTIDMDIIRCNRTTLVGIDGSQERHQKSVSCSDKSNEDAKVRMRCSRKSEGARSTDCKSKSQSPRIHQRSQQKSSVNEKLNATVGTSNDGDEASDDDDGMTNFCCSKFSFTSFNSLS